MASARTKTMETLSDITVPDLGDFKDVPVIEIYVKVGDTVKTEDPLVCLESDKATMDVPAPLSGLVKEIRVKLGDKVSQGSVIMAMASAEAPAAALKPAPMSAATATAAAALPAGATSGGIDEAAFGLAYAGPAVRKLARELGIDLGKVKGSGAHGRIVRTDVEACAKGGGAAVAGAADKRMSTAAHGGVAGIDLLPWPKG